MNADIVDLDYESYLFDPNYNEASVQVINKRKWLEFVYFFIENSSDSILKNHLSYSDEYLEYLKNLGVKIPILDPEAREVQYWWGKRLNLKLEQELNSKITSSKMAQSLSLGFYQGHFVVSKDDLVEKIKLNNKCSKWMLRNPYSFSGIGNKIVLASEVESIKPFNNECLLEPFYDRLCDIGTTIFFDQQSWSPNGIIREMFVVENFNSDKGQFSGGRGFRNLEKFAEYFHDKYKLKVDYIFPILEKIALEYYSLGARDSIQIDSFFYFDAKKEIQFYPLVEVNYRKTMGQFIKKVADIFNRDHLEVYFNYRTQKEDSSTMRLSPKDHPITVLMR